MKKRFFIGVFLIIGIIVLYNYVYKSHRNIEVEKASFIVTSEIILNEFSVNEEEASKKYLDEILEISGVVTSVSNSFLQLDSFINLYFNDTVNRNEMLKKELRVKGRFIGFDELLKEIKLDQCIVLTN